jgi:3-oxoacyl-(acyl-carrier-protein) synthase
MSTKIAITGMGLISPYGVGPELLWERLMAGETGLKPLVDFDTSHIQCRVGGQLSNFQPEIYLSPRITRKIDPFSVYALVTTQFALQNAGLLQNGKNPLWSQQEQGANRVGICVGNNLGGWQFAERELRNLWLLGPREVSPYMATAWFPAAVQGNVSIHFGIKGLGRTFLSDRASGAMAIIHAADCLVRGKADIMIAGGTEAPFSPYAALCYETSGLMSRRAVSHATDVYRPFDTNHDGIVAAEGAVFFVLERVEDALQRGAPILAAMAGWASTYDGYDVVQPNPDGQRYAEAMKQALIRAKRQPDEIDCIFAAGSAVPSEDVSETRAIRLAFGDDADRIPVSTPKSAFGNLFGAATPMDIAIAVLAMQQHVIPGTLHLHQPAQGCDLDYVSQTARPVEQLDACLINARGMGGTNASFVLERYF